jgi:hypothetical protein
MSAIPYKDDEDATLDNVKPLFPKSDLFGALPKSDEKIKQAKKDTFEKILDGYFFHLNTIFAHGAYSDHIEPSEITKMAEIKLCTITSTHPRIGDLRSLFDKVVTRIRTIWSTIGVEQWLNAINDAVTELRFQNNMSALTCPTDKWSDRTSEGKLKPPILNAIVATRLFLEQRKLTLREDIWKSYRVITNENGREAYVSRLTDQIIREWRNRIYESKGTMYPMEILKDAYHQVAKDNEFHSLQEKIKSVAHDGVDRYGAGAKAFGLKTDGEAEENNFTMRVFKQHLIASMARVFYPGVWYDLVLCVFGAQGAGKTTGLRILYGRDNVISCNFFELDPKKQSEATRQGINAVENADTFGDARKADFNRIKADVSIDSFVGRDAYGRVQDMRRVNIAYVIWYTGNEKKVLRDPTGNRRFIIVYSEGPTDEDWLRLNADQLWAQAYIDMEKLRSDYLEGMRAKGIKEEYPKYLELPHDLWEEAKKRQGDSMVDNGPWEEWVSEIIFQNFVIWPDNDAKKSICVLTRDIVKYLSEKCPRNTSISNQALSAAMIDIVLLPKDKCEGLTEDIRWTGAQIKRANKNLRGYRIDFEGDPARYRAFKIIEKLAAANKSPEDDYIENERANNIPI